MRGEWRCQWRSCCEWAWRRSGDRCNSSVHTYSTSAVYRELVEPVTRHGDVCVCVCPCDPWMQVADRRMASVESKEVERWICIDKQTSRQR